MMTMVSGGVKWMPAGGRFAGAVLGLCCAFGLVTNAHAQLEPRLGGLAYYDTVLDITWMQDARAITGTAWDDGVSSTDGLVSWYSAMQWAGQLTINGISGWRLASQDVNKDGVVVECEYASEVECRDNEYGYMYFYNGVTGDDPGLFSLYAYGYWSEAEYVEYPDIIAWLLTFGTGKQHPLGKSYWRHAWAVHDGDVAASFPDTDNDGIADVGDNCPTVANPDQLDQDGNGIGDVCEPPRIDGIWPASAAVGETISLFVFGDHFEHNETWVSVNGVELPLVQVVTPEMLITRVVVTAEMFGPISVVTTNGDVQGVDFGSPTEGLQVGGIWPGTTTGYDRVFVFGSGFSSAALQVRVGTTLVSLVQVLNDNLLIFVVPREAVSAPVYVTTATEAASSSENLIIMSDAQ